MSDGENPTTQRVRRTRSDTRDEASQLIGYEGQDGEVLAVTGDEDAPYTAPLGRASDDGTTGLIIQENGESQRVALDEYGRIWVRAIIDPIEVVFGEVALLRYTTGGTGEVSRAIKATPGSVHRVSVLVPAGAVVDQVLMVFDRTTVPGLGAVPIWRALLNAPGVGIMGEVSDGFGDQGPLICSVGIAIGLSSTLATYTAATGSGAASFFQILYE